MASEDYHWVAHQTAVESLVRLQRSERKAVIHTIVQITRSPAQFEAESFELPNQAPYFILTIGSRVMTFQIDHAVKEVRVLSLE